MTDDPRSALKVPAADLRVHLVEDRRASVSRWGLGNSKLGAHVYTYSRTAGSTATCPGATAACEAVCYAQRMATPTNGLDELFRRNATAPDLSDLPADAEIVRIHVSGDFDSVAYICQWIDLAAARPRVRFFGYTRSWRLPELRPYLDMLRKAGNVQLFASVDADHTREEVWGLARDGWRLSLMGDQTWADRWGEGDRLVSAFSAGGIVCPEETGHRASCEECRYCIDGKRGDVLFPIH